MTEYKGYRILPIHNLIGYTLQHIGRGSIPSALQGAFTSVSAAKRLIDSYKGKEDENGEADTTDGDQQVHRRTSNRRKPADES